MVFCPARHEPEDAVAVGLQLLLEDGDAVQGALKVDAFLSALEKLEATGFAAAFLRKRGGLV